MSEDEFIDNPFRIAYEKFKSMILQNLVTDKQIRLEILSHSNKSFYFFVSLESEKYTYSFNEIELCDEGIYFSFDECINFIPWYLVIGCNLIKKYTEEIEKSKTKKHFWSGKIHG